MKGRAYRPGDTLEGGYVLKAVAATGIIAAGPGGDLKVPLRAASPTPKPTNDRGTP